MNNSIIRPTESSLSHHQHSSGHSPAPDSDGPGARPDRCPSARRRPAGQPNHSDLRAAKANEINIRTHKCKQRVARTSAHVDRDRSSRSSSPSASGSARWGALLLGASSSSPPPPRPWSLSRTASSTASMATWTNPLMRPSIASRRGRTGKADDHGMGCGDGSDWPAAAEWDLGRGGTRAWLVDSTNRVAWDATRRRSPEIS